MNQPIPPRIQALWARGEKIQAIKLLREATGLGLAEAKAVLEGAPLPSRTASATSTPLSGDVRAALQAGNKIEAIKRLREATGLGLKEAKDMVESAAAQTTPSSPLSARRPPAVEVPRGSFASKMVVALAIVIVAIYWFFKGG